MGRSCEEVEEVGDALFWLLTGRVCAVSGPEWREACGEVTDDVACVLEFVVGGGEERYAVACVSHGEQSVEVEAEVVEDAVQQVDEESVEQQRGISVDVEQQPDVLVVEAEQRVVTVEAVELEV